MADESLYRTQEIERLHQEIRDRRKRIIELLREPSFPVTKQYALYDWNNNRVNIADLFGDKEDLILIHNMGKGCTYCTLWADEINGVRHHLENRAALVMVNPNPIEVQKEFAKSRGWGFKILSDRDMQFSTDMGFSLEKEGKRYAQPGYSTFHKNPDGTVVRTGYDEFGPGDMYSSVWHFFELLQDGDNGWEPQYRYEATEAVA